MPAQRPVIYPKLPCIGGPLDGETRSVLDLPSEVLVTFSDGGMKSARYLHAKADDGRDCWCWQETWEPLG